MKDYTVKEIEGLVNTINDHIQNVENIDGEIYVEETYNGYNIIYSKTNDNGDEIETEIHSKLDNLNIAGYLLEGMTMMIGVEHMF